MTTLAPDRTSDKEALKLAAQRRLVEASFVDFLRFVKVQDPPPGYGIRDFEMWPHCVEIANDLPNHQRVIWGKARQIAATTELVAYVRWKMYQPYSEAPWLSQGETEAQEALSKIKIIDRYLPPHLQLPPKPGTRDSKGAIEYINESPTRAMPATAKAGRGGTNSIVIMDEADFHEYFDDNLAAITPTILDHPGRQIIAVSTANPKTVDSGFKRLLREAPENGWHRLFHPYSVRPGRDQAWYDRGLLAAKDKSLWEKEYPRDLAEMLAPPRSNAAFDLDMLASIRPLTRKPIKTMGPISIYYPYRPGGRYGCGTDPSHGTGNDNAVSVIVDFQQKAVVADIMNKNIGPESLATYTMQMLDMYHHPVWAIEDNDWGMVCIKAAQDKSYKRLFHRKTGHGQRKVGWHTDGMSGWVMWGELIEAVNSGNLLITNSEGLDQFFSVVLNEEDSKKKQPGAISGAHDDYPVAVGIALQTIKYSYGITTGLTLPNTF